MLQKKLVKSICTICCLYFLQTDSFAQGTLSRPDTTRLELRQAEKMFLDNNLQLLAEHYNVQSAQALIEQARKWDNPTLVTDQNVYSGNRFFQHGTDNSGNPNGQIFVQVQQLIKTAGKRGKQVSLAKSNADMAEWEFRNVLRNLRSTLIRDYYTVAQLQGNATLFNDNMQRLTTLLAAREAELRAGNIARKEYLRIQALIVSLQQDMTENAKSLDDVESELKTMLQLTGNVFVQPVLADTESAALPQISIVQILDTAKVYNPEYGQALSKMEYSRMNVSLQKSLAVPDLTFGPEFDQNSNYAPNYFGLSISLPIPLWDRNQGNIKSAKYQVKQQEATVKQADQKLQNDVLNAYQKLVVTLRSNSGTAPGFYSDYYELQKNIMESYNKRLIGMIEFLEYFNDYQEVRKKQLQQTLNMRLAKEELNYVAGKDVVR